MAEARERMIEFRSNSHTTPAYLTEPTDVGEHPGVVIIQEWWGLVPHIKDVAERLAREGFIVLAPTCITGRPPRSPMRRASSRWAWIEIGQWPKSTPLRDS